MRKFFADHPILATCLSTTLVLIILFALFTGAVAFIIGKSFSAVSKNLAADLDYSGKRDYVYEYRYGNENSGNTFLSIPIKGVILTSQDFPDPFLFLLEGQTFGYSVKEQIMAAASDSTIKGIILEVNSPGGTITGSKAISDGVEYFKQKTKKPVIAHISGLGVSGSYWAAAATDQIIADSGSLTGSIGVIMGPFKFYNKVLSEGSFLGEVTTEQGIESFNITAGEDKDFGDPYKRLSPKARQVLQQGINNEYETFVNYISRRRNIAPDIIKNQIGALVYDNKQAENFKLIDGSGSREEAYDRLAAEAEVPAGDYQIVGEKGRGFWEDVFEVFAPVKSLMGKNSCLLCGRMLYLYGDPREYTIN